MIFLNPKTLCYFNFLLERVMFLNFLLESLVIYEGSLLAYPLLCSLSVNDTPEVMKQMPPLPVKVNEELANSILPRTNLPMQ